MSKEKRAEFILEPRNLIEVDTDDMIANGLGDEYGGLEMYNLSKSDAPKIKS